MNVSCTKTFTLEVATSCVDWSTIVWDVAEIVILQPGGAGTISASGDTVHFRMTTADPVIQDNARADLHGTVNYTGDGCTFKFRINVVEFDPRAVFYITISQDGVPIYSVGSSTTNSLPAGIVVGMNEFDVVIAAAVGSVIEIRGSRFPVVGNFLSFVVGDGAPTSAIEIIFTFANS
jgi:hypothetical protein